MNNYIYVAGPYSHTDPITQFYRYERAVGYCAKLFLEAKFGLSPVVHCRPVALMGQLPHDFSAWKDFSEELVKHCKEVHVLKLPGWEESEGVKAEIALAKELGKEVVFIDP